MGAELSLSPAAQQRNSRCTLALSLALAFIGAALLQQRTWQQQGGRWPGCWRPLAALPPAHSLGAHQLERLWQLPWVPVLTEEERLRGISYYGSGSRLRRLGRRLALGQPISVHLLGGSITFEGTFAAKLIQWINTTFPHSGHSLTNHAYPASTSTYMAPCFECLIPEDADLVVVELTLNDNVVYDFTNPDRRAYEALIRKTLRLPSQPALLLLHSYAWWLSFGDGRNAGLFYSTTENQLTTFSSYYDVPALSVRAAAWRLMDAGIKGFDPTCVFVDGHIAPATGQRVPVAKPANRSSYYYTDVIHPGRRGFTVLAELLIAALARGVEQAAGRSPTVRADPRLAGLPPPMVPLSPEEHTTFCAMQEAFKAVVVDSSGFKYAPERPEGRNFVDQKWTWSGKKLGHWVDLVIDTRAAPSGPAAEAVKSGGLAPAAAGSGGQGGSGSSEGSEGGKAQAAVQAGGSGSSEGSEGGKAQAAAQAGGSGNGELVAVPGSSEGGSEESSSGSSKGMAKVYLVHLRSYEGMGVGLVQCTSGCSCQPTVLNGTWPYHASIFEAQDFLVTQHQECRLRVTIVETPEIGKNKKQRIALAAALVSHPS